MMCISVFCGPLSVLWPVEILVTKLLFCVTLASVEVPSTSGGTVQIMDVFHGISLAYVVQQGA